MDFTEGLSEPSLHRRLQRCIVHIPLTVAEGAFGHHRLDTRQESAASVHAFQISKDNLDKDKKRLSLVVFTTHRGKLLAE